ncbi:MAG: coproporphyrinogen-III oxidase family protein [Deferrisomatales bacterium]|nr:coproporphyrinogen-III oxidase family protein [Deferrisomatales bacterium]
MPEKNLIERAGEIQRRLTDEVKSSQGFGSAIDDFDQRIRYVYYVKSGSRVGTKEIHGVHTRDIHEMELYVHVPFCRKRCTYCCYFSIAEPPDAIVASYVTSLKRELELLRGTSRFENAVVKHIYLGGGTPTFLEARQLSDLIQSIRSSLTVLPTLNFTCEVSPESIVSTEGREKLQTLRENGVNRLSLGVQSFDDGVLELIGRGHTSKIALAAYRNACETGFSNINLDLMFGLPGQDLQSWERDLETATGLNPVWLSLSRLRFDNPAMDEMQRRRGAIFPDAETSFLMNIMAIEKVTKSGYQQAHAPGNFRRRCTKKFPPRHWLGQQTLAVGAGAWSYLNGVRYSNVRNLGRYAALVNEGRLPISSAWEYSELEQMEKETILMLRLPTGVNRREFDERFGVDIEQMFIGPWDRLREAGMITDDGETFRLSYKGLVFAVEVIKQFYSENLMDKCKNVVYHHPLLRRLFLRAKYTRWVEGLANLARAASGVSKMGRHRKASPRAIQGKKQRPEKAC